MAKEVGGEAGLTEAGRFVGTADYTAPEQLAGGEVDERADVYSFGCLAQFLLAARGPSSSGPEVPGAAGSAIARALAPDPANRPGSAGQVVLELSEAFGFEPTPRIWLSGGRG